ncbi:MAG TPA: Hsp20/alpha crystallin family protein [Candidatus Binataceae bacterium]|nr:Hsp20/alpha crystallin family protein [Candidatus Binataceae bacterium]
MMPEAEIVAKEKQQVEGAEKTRPGRYFQPDVDICESEKTLRLWADMPGVSEKDVNVSLKDRVLSITGLVTAEAYDKLAPLYTEYNVGSYYREFALHAEIDVAGITARMRNGVLEVELPKRQEAQPRRIEVQKG